MKVLMLLLALNLSAVPVPETSASFTCERPSIQYGQETTLSWKVAGVDSVFISTIGEVPAEGRKVVRPENSTEYTLMAEGANVNAVIKLKVAVEGGRGQDDFPRDLDRFKFPNTFTMSNSSTTQQLGRIHKILQDDMRFSVKEYQTDEGFFFLTNSSQRDYLLDPSERRIRARYISYLVKVGKQDGRTKALPVTISSMIEYIRGGESTKRLETTDTLYQTEAIRLRTKITGGP